MPKSSDPLLRGMWLWANSYTDMWDWGIKDVDGEIKSANTNESFLRGVMRQGHPQKLSQKLIREHLAGSQTLYMRAHRHSPVQVIAIDIDAHDGQDDAACVLQWVLSLHPGAYHEPSTHGAGYHVILHVAKDTLTPWEWVSLCTDYGRALALLAADRGCQAQVEVKGVCSAIGDDEWGGRFVHRGSLIRYPRLPHGLPSLLNLTTSPVFEIPDLQNIIHLAAVAAEPTLSTSQWLPQSPSVPHGDAGTVLDGDAVLGEVLYPPVAAGGKEQRRPIAAAKQLIHKNRLQNLNFLPDACELESVDALVRMRARCLAFARELGRVPDVEELVERYEKDGLATGEDRNGRRRKRARQVVEFVGQTFDPSCVGGRFDAMRPALTAAIESAIPACERRQVYLDHLCVVAYCLGTGRPCAVSGLLAFADSLGSSLLVRMRDTHVAAAKRLLVAHGILAVIDAGYVPGLKGQTFGRGERWPLWQTTGIDDATRR